MGLFWLLGTINIITSNRSIHLLTSLFVFRLMNKTKKKNHKLFLFRELTFCNYPTRNQGDAYFWIGLQKYDNMQLSISEKQQSKQIPMDKIKKNSLQRSCFICIYMTKGKRMITSSILC